ncbi:MAG: hypothetical protein ACTSUE_27600 [Promethearchaeota archaeon]
MLFRGEMWKRLIYIHLITLVEKSHSSPSTSESCTMDRDKHIHPSPVYSTLILDYI